MSGSAFSASYFAEGSRSTLTHRTRCDRPRDRKAENHQREYRPGDHDGVYQPSELAQVERASFGQIFGVSTSPHQESGGESEGDEFCEHGGADEDVERFRRMSGEVFWRLTEQELVRVVGDSPEEDAR